MRFRDDIRKCVAFIGVGEGDGFVSSGTAFTLGYKGLPYLVTASHVAEDLQDDPFTFRVNGIDGEPIDFSHDPVDDKEDYKWHFHTDRTVDLAVMQLTWSWQRIGADVLMLPESMLAPKSAFAEQNIGIGDACYAVGLFRLMRGKKRILPFVHTGSIGLMPDDERIPVEGWRTPKETTLVEGYLVEMTSLEGLSGSPVFVRPSTPFEWFAKDGKKPPVFRWPDEKVWLLGVWQGAWSGDPDASLASQIGRQQVKVPLGIGVVTPTSKLIEILESPEIVAKRDAFIAAIRGVKEKHT